MGEVSRARILTCVEWSVYPFYSHAAVMMKERPRFEVTVIPRLDGAPR